MGPHIFFIAKKVLPKLSDLSSSHASRSGPPSFLIKPNGTPNPPRNLSRARLFIFPHPQVHSSYISLTDPITPVANGIF